MVHYNSSMHITLNFNRWCKGLYFLTVHLGPNNMYLKSAYSFLSAQVWQPKTLKMFELSSVFDKLENSPYYSIFNTKWNIFAKNATVHEHSLIYLL